MSGRLPGANAIMSLVDRGPKKDVRHLSSHPMTKVTKKEQALWFCRQFWPFRGITCKDFGMNGQDAEVMMPSRAQK